MGRLLGTLKSGDVIRFSGDAVFVLYEPDKSEGAQAMRNATSRAVSEGLKALYGD